MTRVLAALALLAGLALLPASPAGASVPTPGGRALSWAESHAAGRPYAWGGTGPYGYDCSGLVVASVRAADGITLPRTTYSMPSNWHLYRVSVPQRGDLAFWGTSHVEMVTAWPHTTFGAHHSGERVGWQAWNRYYAPTAFYRLR